MENYDYKISYLQKSLLLWFQQYRRDFPWRQEQANDYEKIISEILLQRTKAETVANFYSIFLSQYPSWKALGKATEEELQNALQPLGLHRQRGHRLYKLAQDLKNRQGQFPTTIHEVAEMSMMGQYIVNAFELFILKQPKPLLDVNMAGETQENFYNMILTKSCF